MIHILTDGCYVRFVLGAHRILALATIFVVTSSCGGPTPIQHPVRTEPANETTQIPGEPVVLKLATGRAHVVRLVEPDDVATDGRLQVTSTSPGVMVVVDDGERLPLPLVIQIVVGPHEVRALCPNSTSESFNVVVEPEATVHLRVCSPRRRP